jgi:hypothetical protein
LCLWGYPDALPLSEFNLRGDMLVYDLPDETLLPFEGSGIERSVLSLPPRTPWKKCAPSRFAP